MSDAVKRAAQHVVQAPRRAAVGYWRGFTYPMSGMKAVYAEHSDLVRIWIWPLIITALAMGGVGWAVWSYHDALLATMWTEPSGEGWLASIGRFIHGMLEVVLGIILFFGGLIAVHLLTSVFAAPFNDSLSEALEMRFTGRKAKPFSWSAFAGDLLRTVALEAGKLTIYIGIMLPMLIFSWVVPGCGQVVYAIFGFLFSVLYLAVDYVDWPAARRGWSVGKRARFARKNLVPMLGFGTGVWILLFIPFANLLFMPAAVAGGTRLFLDLAGPAEGVSDAVDAGVNLSAGVESVPR